MRRPPSILIIGAGLIGLSCADSLSRRGAKVTVIEAKDGPARVTSFANSGMIHPSQAMPWNADTLTPEQLRNATQSVYSLATQSRNALENNLSTLHHGSNPLQEGCLQIFPTQTERDLKAALYASFQIPHTKEIPQPFKNTQFFQKSDKTKTNKANTNKANTNKAKVMTALPTIFFPNDLSGNAYKYCLNVSQSLKQRAVKQYFSCRVTSIKNDKNKTKTIETSKGTFTADHIIIAAGNASADLLAPLGVNIATYPERGYALDFKKPDFRKLDINLPPCPVMDYRSRSALTIFEDRIRLSGTTGEDSPKALLGIWKEHFPNLIAALDTPFQTWQADRPMSSRGRPYIGPTHHPNLWVNTGHGHMGWTLSAGSGELIAGMILDGHIDPRFAITYL